jgi:hypothetical protein
MIDSVSLFPSLWIGHCGGLFFALARTVRLHVQNRALVYGNRTVVFA